ncbi:sperm-egg fusion protein LLCFC1-like [Cavia porcellus]|uniref:sperm-egg fusion protein LLCFC1-like n=1 Tax=Cavia porcellus TaxID=10141 RepID=UPI00022B79F4|nr:LLLL and CFNLAS motif-containing protein 1-like [Cavia porcellus]
MTSLGSQPHRAAFLAAILLLLKVEVVNTEQGSPGPGEKSLEGKMPPAEQGQELYEEHFMASSVGEQWQEVDMAQQEDDITSETAGVQDHLFDLTFCSNLASIMLFL